MVERNKEYQRYLHSQNWRLRVIRKLAMNKGLTNFQRLWLLTHEKAQPTFQFICDDCEGRFSRQDIDEHHITYARIFHEGSDDLATLCRTCHKRRHGLPVRKRIETRVRKPSPEVAGLLENTLRSPNPKGT